MVVPFGNWTPDKFPLNTPMATEALGVIADSETYKPFLSLQSFGTPLPAPCKGAVLCRRDDDSFVLFAGTAKRLYKFLAIGEDWLDVSFGSSTSSGNYDLPGGDYWSFRQFRNNLIAVNGTNNPQYIDINDGTQFADLPGGPPKARFVEVVGDQVFLYGLPDDPLTMIWSGTNNAGQWTVGKDNCDYQTFPEGGHIVGVSPLETGLIFQSNAINRIQRNPSAALYSFSLIEDSRGLIAPNSLVFKSNTAFYLSEEGFFATDGSGASKGIGFEAVDKWFRDRANYDRLAAVLGVADPVDKRIYWLYPSAGNATFPPDRIICFNYEVNRWTHANITAEYILTGATPAWTADTIDQLLGQMGQTLETASFSFDATFLRGGILTMAAFDETHTMGFFTGPTLEAVVETANWQLTPSPGKRTYVNGVYIVGDPPAATVTVATKSRPMDTATYGAPAPLNAQGFCPLRASGQELRARVTIPASTVWTSIKGIDPVIVPEGRR